MRVFVLWSNDVASIRAARLEFIAVSRRLVP